MVETKMTSISQLLCIHKILLVLLASLSPNETSAFSTRQRFDHLHIQGRTRGLHRNGGTTLQAATEEAFENWFSSISQSSLHGSIRHTFFGQLRGLTWTSPPTSIPSSPVVSVPLSIVLQSDIQDQSSESDGWDAELAQQLWSECLLGESSKISGYCDFLKQGLGVSETGVPSSTAPNALRHWTEDERATLCQTSAGQKLLDLETRQQELWKSKYNKLGSTVGKTMSYEQFQWAMEVVHSRAFRGNFGSNAAADNRIVSTLLPTVLPPLGAALAGYAYVQSTPYPSDTILAALAAVAVLPLGFNLLRSSFNLPSAVLLPMIDSANHEEDADSSIEYDPLTNCFQMSIGPKCLLDSPDPASKDLQLCTSYGKRSDAELLLNYGFLPGVTCWDDAPLSEQRTRLAEAFNSRNS